MPTRILKTIEIKVNTTQRNEMIDVTTKVNEAMSRERLSDGVAVIYSPHTTAGVCIQENADPSVRSDLLSKLELLIPKAESFYRHSEGNSDSHLKTVLTGNSVTVILDDGKLMLGQWQGVYLCEYDGPRERNLWIKVFQERIHSNEYD